MPDVYLITHPDVIKSPDVAVPRWPLSPRGRERMTAMLARPWVAGLGAVYCSEDGAESWTSIARGLAPVSKGRHYANLAQRADFLGEAANRASGRLTFVGEAAL